MIILFLKFTSGNMDHCLHFVCFVCRRLLDHLHVNKLIDLLLHTVLVPLLLSILMHKKQRQLQELTLCVITKLAL